MGFGKKIRRLVKDPKKTIKHTYHRIDYSTGKSLFGNTAGLQNNVSGSLQSVGNNSIKSEDANELKRIGFFKLGQIYEKPFFDSIKSKFQKMIEDDEYSYARVSFDNHVFMRQLKNNPCPIPEFAELLNNEIKAIMSDYFGGDFQVKRLIASRNYHIPPEIQAKKEFYADHWHCDARDVDSYWKAFILLSDVTEDDGPLHLHPRERTKELIQMGFGTRDDYNLSDNVLYDPKSLVRHTGPAGTVVIGNPAICLHRAGIPAPGHHRDIIYMIMGRSNQVLSDDWLNHQDPDHKYD